jgi:hypothetical protein
MCISKYFRFFKRENRIEQLITEVKELRETVERISADFGPSIVVKKESIQDTLTKEYLKDMQQNNK